MVGISSHHLFAATGARSRCGAFALACIGWFALAGCSTSEDPTPSPDAGQILDPDAQVIDSACDTTWKAIQKSIFQGDGCTSSKCHSGDQPAGALSLESDAALERLVFAKPQASISSPMYLIQPGEQALSFLYLKLAASTENTPLPAGGGAPMPSGLAPISQEHLTALRLWIRAGAPRSGVVAGTQGLLACTLSAIADPNKAPRPPVPAADQGFQQVAGPWSVEANSENEVCFATYYDLSASAPDWAKLPCDLGASKTCVGYKRRQLSQDAQSHHSIINIYTGTTAATDPSWGPWRCAGGALAGTACDPTQIAVSATQGGADCGEGSVCQSEPKKTTACRGWGPSDRDTAQVGAGGAQSPVSSNEYPAGVYARIPVQGVIIWNSHGFNLTSKPTTVEQYNTFWYAKPEERQYPVRSIFDTSHIFVMNVPPFEQREYCATFTLPQYAHLAELGSHAHKRGVKWRTWLPPNVSGCEAGVDCAPNDSVPAYLSRLYNDPLVLRFDPALTFDDPDPATRTLKYCSVYDNGKDDPSLVKRKSTLPSGSSPCSNEQLACLGGEHQGELCGGVDANCGTGTCDACPVRGGVTTEDEMFILLGNYYVVQPAQ